MDFVHTPYAEQKRFQKKYLPTPYEFSFLGVLFLQFVCSVARDGASAAESRFKPRFLWAVFTATFAVFDSCECMYAEWCALVSGRPMLFAQ